MSETDDIEYELADLRAKNSRLIKSLEEMTDWNQEAHDREDTLRERVERLTDELAIEKGEAAMKAGES